MIWNLERYLDLIVMLNAAWLVVGLTPTGVYEVSKF